jgi:hypothetical protein
MLGLITLARRDPSSSRIPLEHPATPPTVPLPPDHVPAPAPDTCVTRQYTPAITFVQSSSWPAGQPTRFDYTLRKDRCGSLTTRWGGRA